LTGCDIGIQHSEDCYVADSERARDEVKTPRVFGDSLAITRNVEAE
jgi:hypothetical protein